MQWKKLGFTNAKPKVPGVYFVAAQLPTKLAAPEHERDGWDVAFIMFFAGSYHNPSDNREDNAHWRIHSLGGASYSWAKGMWIKGPISPTDNTGGTACSSAT